MFGVWRGVAWRGVAWRGVVWCGVVLCVCGSGGGSVGWWLWCGRDVIDMTLSICHHGCIKFRWQNT